MAARRHWRFVVRDTYGYVIQNARVNVYLPGTTTVFAGTAYNAASGGGTVTNPFITNAQGEVEAWFDTAQIVDVQVDDNSNTAYRVVGGASDLSDFSTFTEKDDIYVSASDQMTAENFSGLLDWAESGDLSTIDPGDAAAAGSSTEVPRADHQHANTGLPNAHGIASHTNVTRQLYLPAAIGTPQVGALATLGTYPNVLRVTTLADAVSTNGMFWHFAVPDDWDSGDFLVEPIWVPGSTDGTPHTVRWQIDAKQLTGGTDVTAAGTTTAVTGGSAARTANQIVYDSIGQSGVTPSFSGVEYRLALTRLGADGADTYVGVVNLAGVRLAYTATQ